MLTACDATDELSTAERWSSEPIRQNLHTGISAWDGLEAGRYKLWLVAPSYAAVEIEVAISPAFSLTRIVD